MISNKSKTNISLRNTKNTLPFKRNLSVALISSSLLFACGGGSSGGSVVAPPAPMSITGTASKGLILGGEVNAYLINSNGTKVEPAIGTAITDATDGSYELTLDSSYDGEPLIIEITAVDGSQMKCDLSVCLADDDDEVAITFGELYTLPTDFELSAVSSGTDSDTISINITPLTNIAAALTLDKIAEGAEPAAAAEASNYQIADLLGLDGDVTEQPIVDLTDPTAINGASAAELNANLKAAAVVEAALMGASDGTSLEAALDDFVMQYVDSGIAETEEGEGDNTLVSQEEIAAASQTLTSAMVTELEGVNAEDDNIAAVQTALMAEEEEAATGSTQATQGDVPDDLGSEGLIATKEFVSQVSTFSLATQLDGADTFEEEISLASDLVSSDLDVSSEALALATAAIAGAIETVLDSETPVTSYQSDDGITVAISLSGTTVTYTVDQTLDIENSAGVATTATIDLVAVNAVFSDGIEDAETETETEGTYTYTWSAEGEASVDLALSGSVSTDKVSIAINDGSNVVATLTVDEEEREEGTSSASEGSSTRSETNTASGLISVTGVDFGLSVTIAQVASSEVSDPISFTGVFNIAASLLSLDYDEASEYNETRTNSEVYTDDRDYTNSETEVISIDGLTASLSGMFSDSTNSIEATVAIAASGIEETCELEHEWSNLYTNDNGVENNTFDHDNNEDCGLTGETATTYASASINVRFALDIDGIDGDVEVEAAIERTGLEAGIASIDLTYGGNQLDFAFDTDDIVEVGEGDETITTTMTATLTNHNGVVLTITDVETDYVDGSELSDTFITTGVISHDGEEFATVNEDGIVTFSDGTFVTL